MKIFGSFVAAALLVFATASDTANNVRRGNQDDTKEEESSMWERILDGHVQYGSLPPRPPPASYPVLPPTYSTYTAPQPVYHTTVTQPAYYEPPVPKPVHYDPPVPKPVYHEPPAPKPVYYEPPVPKPVYHEPPAPKPVYYEPPVPKPVYHEPPAPKPVEYNEPSSVYHHPVAEPTYQAPVLKPTRMAHSPERSSYHEEPTKHIPEPTYHDPASSYDDPKPVYHEPYEDKDYHVGPDKYSDQANSADTYKDDGSCHVKVAVDCKDSFGGPCDKVHTPMANKCSNGNNFEVLTFKYENGKCNPSSHSQGGEAVCEDKGSFAFWDAVDVYCRKASTTKNLVVEPRNVPPGGTFTVSNPGGYLPDKIDCIFRDPKGRVVQHNLIDASGDVDLYLMDSFGAMTVYSCAALGCIETLDYHVNIENLGDVPLDIEMVDFLLNDDKYHLLSDMEKKSLSPGESTVVSVAAEVEICRAGFTYDAYVYVEAYPAAGKMCMDDISFTFKINIPPAPTTAKPTEPPASLIPTASPTTSPTEMPTLSASSAPTNSPTTLAPTTHPSEIPTSEPSPAPSERPTPIPSSAPTASPTVSPTLSPTNTPSSTPTYMPTTMPSASPTEKPSSSPSESPTSSPSASPTPAPSARPSNPLEGFCSIDTQVECALANGRPCEYAEKPYSLDCTGPSYVLHFSYQFCFCDEHANDQGDHSECTDFAPLVEEPVLVQCAGTYGGHLYVSPHIVEPAQRFSVSTYDGSVLPKKIDCTVFDSHGRPLQRNIIDTSGAAPLTLGDKYGALQLDSCDEISCKEFFNYRVFISNTASDPALITDATFFFNELSGDVVSELGTNPLKAGQSTSLDFKFDLDICSGQDYCARIIAKASPPDGAYCASESKRTINFDPYGGGTEYRPYYPEPVYPKPNPVPYKDPYSVPVRAPTPVPSSDIIMIDGSCSIADGPFAGKDPSTIDWSSQTSIITPTRLVLRYTGKSCGSTPECFDGPGGTPRGSVVVRASDNAPPGTIYNSTLMESDGLFVIEHNKIGAKTRLMVESSDGSAIYQTLFLDTSANGFSLMDEYGAFKVIAFTNNRQGLVSVFGKVDMTVSMSAPRLKNAQSVRLETVVEDAQSPIIRNKPLDLTPRFKGLSIRPGRSIPRKITNVTGRIDLSSPYSVTMALDATGTLLPDGKPATGSLHFTCFIGQGSRRYLADSTEESVKAGEP